MNTNQALKMTKDLAEKYNEHVSIDESCGTFIASFEDDFLKTLHSETTYYFYINDVYSKNVKTWAEVVALYDKYMAKK